MKYCKHCGSPLRLDTELTEGRSHFVWYKCTFFPCGALYLVEKHAKHSQAKAEGGNHA